MAQKAYLLKLAGMGDHDWKLLNQEAYDHFLAVSNWRPRSGAPVPTPSQALLNDVATYCSDEHCEETAEELLAVEDGSSFDNDLALRMPSSSFNGERYRSFDASITNLLTFVQRHDLELVEAYEGVIY